MNMEKTVNGLIASTREMLDEIEASVAMMDTSEQASLMVARAIVKLDEAKAAAAESYRCICEVMRHASAAA